MFCGASAQDGGGLPPASAPVTASTSHAGRHGGRLMSEPTECEGDEPSVRGHRTRSRQPESPADVLLRRARGRRFWSARNDCQALSPMARQVTDSAGFSALLGSPASRQVGANRRESRINARRNDLKRSAARHRTGDSATRPYPNASAALVCASHRIGVRRLCSNERRHIRRRRRRADRGAGVERTAGGIE
jgi:hypothetical protein